MRVLLALDGSASADTARNLVASLSWPEATIIRIVGVVEPLSAVLIGAAGYAATEAEDRRVGETLDDRLREAATRLAAPGRTIETRLLHGRPASEIVEQAADLRANLIVIGSRGLGRVASMLLGSVSAEVVDHAPCPVLVARASSIGPVLVAVDASDSAKRAVDHLCDAPYLAGHPLHVLSVGPMLSDGLPSWTLPLDDAPGRQATYDRHAEVRLHTEASAARAAEELARAGFDVRWTAAAGDAAHEIIEAARDLSCDLIVMGSRGLTGLDRLLLGSVARNVLLHAPTSVLIVREPVRERVPERMEAPARAFVLGGALLPAV
jgi:nucleotide-binding universal stress UspA family protein